MVCHFNLLLFDFKESFLENPTRKNETENTQSQQENGTSQSDTNQSNGNLKGEDHFSTLNIFHFFYSENRKN